MDAAGTGTLLPDINSTSRTRGTRGRKNHESLQTKSVVEKSAQILPQKQIALFRNSPKQNMFVGLLQEGFHRSFSELFFLLRSDQDRRAAEPMSTISLQVPLEEQHDKLETMKLHLSRAEHAERTGSWALVYEQRLLLGRYFSAPQDLWLSFHFYLSCTEGHRGDHLRPAAEARSCLAELYLQQGVLEQARQQAELCVQVADDDLLDSSGRPLRLRASQTLWSIYSRLADADEKEALKLLHKGYVMGMESENKEIEAAAAFRLGLTYQSAGDHDAARQFLNTCVEICSRLQNADGLGKAYKALAKLSESEGHTHETIKCLEKFIDVSRSNGLQHNQADGCLCLGKIYYTRGQYDRASEFFLQGYDVAGNVGDEALQQKAQVWVASARTHSLIRRYGADVLSATPTALQQLLVWKTTRGGLEDPMLLDNNT